MLKRMTAVAVMAAVAGLTAGCAGVEPGGPVVVVDGREHMGTEEAYRLGTGDRVRMLVYNEPKLSGEFDVDGSGYAALPLIGEVEVRGLTLREFEARVQERLSNYLVDPRVSAEVTNFRPFYVIGDVNSPGRLPYAEGLTVQNAIARAGGYTVWADQTRVIIDREGRDELLEARDLRRFRVMPGDTIRVPQRRW
jgi:protein involved in polysaccharide export with SLBB domain